MDSPGNNYLWVWIVLAVCIFGIAAWASTANNQQGYVTVKYRSDQVDISSSNFESLDKSDSTVKGAWYDPREEYMVIKLTNIYYHYCGMPIDAWAGLKLTTTPYSFYENNLKGNYDCRFNHVPSY